MSVLEAPGLVLLGERANPKRSFLLVSTVLGKHVPLPVAVCRAAGAALALEVAGDPRAAAALDVVLRGDVVAAATLLEGLARTPARGAQDATVVGFAETATGLTHQVGEALDCAWLQTTTRHPDAAATGLAFEESHSHAPDQWLEPLPDDLPDGPLVLVDDELSTGATCANLIRVLHARQPRLAYVVACLVDARPDAAGPLDALARELEVAIDVVGLVRRPPVEAPAPGWSGGALPTRRVPEQEVPGTFCSREVAGPPRAERDGLDREARAAFRAAARGAADAVGPLPPGTLVLGCGEHLALPQLAALANGPATLTSSTTRSPALVTDIAGYPLQDGLAFAHPEAPGLPGYAYNVRAAQRPHVVVHLAEPAHRDAAGPLLHALQAAGAPEIITVTLRS